MLYGREREKENSGNVAWLTRSLFCLFFSLLRRRAARRCTPCASPLFFSFFHARPPVCLSSFNVQHRKIARTHGVGTIRRVRDVTYTGRATLSTYVSSAPRSERFDTPFFSPITTFASPRQTASRARPSSRNSVLFQPIHIRVRNLHRNEPMYHTVTLSFSNQRPVRAVCLTPSRQNTVSLLLSHSSSNVLFFEHTRYFLSTRINSDDVSYDKDTLAIFTRATIRAPLHIPPCFDVTFGGTVACWRWRKPYWDRCSWHRQSANR